VLTWAIVPARASTPSRRAWKRLRSPALLPSAGGGPLCGGVGLLRAPPPHSGIAVVCCLWLRIFKNYVYF